MTDALFKGLSPDKSIAQYIHLMTVTPLDIAIEQWQVPQHQWATLKLLRAQLVKHGKYKKSTVAQGGTTVAQALAEGGVTRKEVLEVWVPAVVVHCEKTLEADPLNKN